MGQTLLNLGVKNMQAQNQFHPSNFMSEPVAPIFTMLQAPNKKESRTIEISDLKNDYNSSKSGINISLKEVLEIINLPENKDIPRNQIYINVAPARYDYDSDEITLIANHNKTDSEYQKELNRYQNALERQASEKKKYNIARNEYDTKLNHYTKIKKFLYGTKNIIELYNTAKNEHLKEPNNPAKLKSYQKISELFNIYKDYTAWVREELNKKVMSQQESLKKLGFAALDNVKF